MERENDCISKQTQQKTFESYILESFKDCRELK